MTTGSKKQSERKEAIELPSIDVMADEGSPIKVQSSEKSSRQMLNEAARLGSRRNWLGHYED